MERLGHYDDSADFAFPQDKPLTALSYAASPLPEALFERLGVSAPVADMPLFLHPDFYVHVPLEATYQATQVCRSLGGELSSDLTGWHASARL